MVVNLIKTDRMFSLTLPEKVKGQFWLNDFDEKGAFRQLVSIEGIDGKWYVKSNKKAAIIGDKNVIVEKNIYGIANIDNTGFESIDIAYNYFNYLVPMCTMLI